MKQEDEMLGHLESCQNDLLSSLGTTSVAFMIRATATMSHIWDKNNNHKNEDSGTIKQK